MAKKLSKFAFPDRARYPWDEWLDGSPWALTAGEDFPLDVQSMRVSAYLMAKARGLKVRTSCRGGSNVLVIQAYKPDDAA